MVEGRGEAVGVAPLGRDRAGQVDELVRGLGVEPVPRGVVDLVVRRRRQLSGVARARRVVKSLEGVQSHASPLISDKSGHIVSAEASLLSLSSLALIFM